VSASACSNSAAATTQRTSPLLTALITKQDTLPLTADLTGDGKADIVGFGDPGVWVALNNGNGTFPQPAMAVANFAYGAGSWNEARHPRFLADLTGNRAADIAGFGEAGVWVSLNNGHGTFAQPAMAVANFGYSAGVWRAERHPRFVAGVGAIGASAGTVD
jgi:hypothetical protein